MSNRYSGGHRGARPTTVAERAARAAASRESGTPMYAGKEQHGTRAAGFVFDPNGPHFDVDPFPTYAFMREHLPVYWWEQAHGWVVTRYEDVAMVLGDPRFATLPGGGPQPVPDELLTLHQRLTKYGLFWLPDSYHERVRRIATPLFMPKLVRSLRHKFEEVADAMLAARPHGPKFDVVQDFAVHYPLAGIIHL